MALFPWAVFLLFFITGPLGDLSGLQAMPGDLRDARLNNYFLENIYLFAIEPSRGLWHLRMLWPFPYVGGFSDNLFGASPLYLLPRFLTGEADTAFQIWFLSSYAANFAACYYALRGLGIGIPAATCGALVFTFALPVTARDGHAQLSYRFPVPLAAVSMLHFLQNGNWRHLLSAFAWLVWQLYGSIYIGFFLSMLLAAMAVSYGVYVCGTRRTCWMDYLLGFRSQWTTARRGAKTGGVLALLVLVGLTLLLFYPYGRVSELYGFKRPVEEITTMLPRPQSYFYCDRSWLWRSSNETFTGLPIRHEHQMFIGLVPLALLLWGLIATFRGRKPGAVPVALAGALFTLIVVTLYWGGISLWILFCQLPVASAIRAMTRIDLVLLFPAAYFAATGVDRLRQAHRAIGPLAVTAIMGLFLFEFLSASLGTTPKAEWRSRLDAKDRLVPAALAPDSVLFFAQQGGHHALEDLDAMWVALRRGRPTLSGYTGHLPAGFSWEFAQDLAELPRRIVAWISFVHAPDPERTYRELVGKVIPVGFAGQATAERLAGFNPPQKLSTRPYSPEELSVLRLRARQARSFGGRCYVEVEVSNSGDQRIITTSALGKSIRLAWRVADPAGPATDDWHQRKDIVFDIPAGGTASVELPIGARDKVNGRTLEVSIVQEREFWLQDHGFEPLRVPLADPDLPPL